MGIVQPDATLRAIDAIAVLLLATALGSVLLQRLDAYIAVIAAQGILLGAAAAALAIESMTAHAYIAVLLTVAVKAVGVPAILSYALRHVRPGREVEAVIPGKLGFPLAVGLVLLAYHVTGSVASADPALTHNALPAATSLLLVGMSTMATRRKALTQVMALVMMENGIYFAALVATRGLPLAVELGVAADVLVGVIVMGLVARQIQRTFDTIDTDRLQALRG